MMTFVFFLIMVLVTVSLEHAYVMCGRTLSLEAFDKAAESVLGNYYAPLFAEYGLLGVYAGEGAAAYADVEAIETAVADTYNRFFAKADTDVTSAMWDSVMGGCKLENIAYITGEDGRIYIDQVRDEVLYDGITYLTNELIALGESDTVGMESLINDVSNQAKTDSYDTALSSSGDGSEDGEEENDSDEDEEDSTFSDIWETLTTLLTEGVSGLWFEDTENLSEKEIDKSELPSNCLKTGLSDDGDTLFYSGDIDAELIDSGEYVDEMVSDDYLADFMEAAQSLSETMTDKAALTAYACFNMDSYLKDLHKDGGLDYEQEYIIFGADSDRVNVRRMGWALFGIRLAVSLAVVLSDPAMQGKIEEYIAILELIPELAAALKILLSVVWAVEIAVVETAALLKGKSVDFIGGAASAAVKFEEIFSFTKAFINRKADSYAPATAVALPYQAYLTVFTFLTPEKKVAYRQMDIIELNMAGKYNSAFKMEEIVVGFSCHGYIRDESGFINLGFFSHGRDFHKKEAETAVFIN